MRIERDATIAFAALTVLAAAFGCTQGPNHPSSVGSIEEVLGNGPPPVQHAHVAAAPAVADPGDPVTISGTGFAVSSTVDITLGPAQVAASIPTTSKGSFSVRITVPGSIPAGSTTIVAIDAYGTDASTHFLITSDAPAIALSPTSGRPGSAFSVSGANFAASETVSIFWDGTLLATRTANSTGHFGATPTVPGQAAAGAHTVLAQGATGDGASATFTVVVPTIQVSPSSAPRYATVQVSGSSFTPAPGLFVNIFLCGQFVGTSGVASDGTFSTSVQIPGTAGPGDCTMQASDSAGDVVNISFTVLPSSITVSPAAAARYAMVTVSGSGFQYNGTAYIKLCDQFVGIGVVAGDGTFVSSVPIPGTVGPGDCTMLAYDTAGDSASTSFTVLPSSIAVSPAAAPHYATVTLRGAGFQYNSLANIFLCDQFNGVASVGSDGTFVASVLVTGNLTPGTCTLSVSDSANDSASTSFTVLPSSIAVSPAAAARYASVTVSGAGFQYNGTAYIKLCDQFVGIGVVGGDGTFVSSVPIPGNLAPGDCTLVAYDTVGDAASTRFTILPSSIAVSPAAAPHYATVTLRGAGFQYNSLANIFLCDQFNGVASVGSDGTFVASVLVTGNLTPGTCTLSVSDSVSDTASTSFTVLASSIAVSPAAAPRYTSVTVSGAGFQYNSIANIFLCGQFDGVAGVGSDGTFVTSVPIPGSIAPGDCPLSASDSVGDYATVSLTVLPPTIVLSSTSGPAGTTVTVTGTGFMPNAQVGINFDASSLAQLVADGTGGFSLSVTIPSTAGPGVHQLVATDTSSNTASATFTIPCPTGQTLCGSTCTTLTNRDNCGACGNVCPGGWMCNGAFCIPT
jgi:hypothetical protein